MPSNKDYIRFRHYIGGMFSTDLLDEVIQWMRDNMKPDEVFTTAELDELAEDNGFIKKENQPS